MLTWFVIQTNQIGYFFSILFFLPEMTSQSASPPFYNLNPTNLTVWHYHIDLTEGLHSFR